MVIPMYDELIKRLRETSVDFGESDHVSVMMLEAADAIEELEKQLREEKVDNVNLTGWLAEEHAKHLWIPVTERLPEDYEQVLTCDERGNIHIFPHLRHFKYPFGIRPEDPRFFMPKWWMPLPQPPKDGEA